MISIPFGSAINIILEENSSPEYYNILWPSARLLSAWLWSLDTLSKHNRLNVLEIGAGLGLPSIVIAKKYPKANILITDASQSFSHDNINNTISNNLTLNNLTNVKVASLDWGNFKNAQLLVSEHFKQSTLSSLNVILASDVLYESKSFDIVLGTIAYILSLAGEDCVCYMGYQERCVGRSLEWLFGRWGLAARKIGFEGDFDSPVSCCLVEIKQNN